MIILDRFEETFAILENTESGSERVSKELIPREAREGDVLVFCDGRYEVDTGATQKRKEEIEKKFFDLFE